MKKGLKLAVILLPLLYVVTSMCTIPPLYGQSAVYVYMNETTGKGDYMFVYGMQDKEHAEQIAEEKLIELGYGAKYLQKLASTDSSGYGTIIRGIFKNEDGLNVSIYGAALGCQSPKEAERLAFQNLKLYNPSWSGDSYKVIQVFLDEVDN